MAEEKQFENKVKEFLKQNGAWYVKYWAGAPYTKSGIPDILACIDGHFVGIELKSSNGRPSALQIYNVRKIRESGGAAFVLYPSAFMDFQKFVSELHEGNFTIPPEIWR